MRASASSCGTIAPGTMEYKRKSSTKFDPTIHHRRSIRLPGYDYAQEGFYFVTICSDHRECLFGQVVDGQVKLTRYGLVVAESWAWLAERYPQVELDKWILMPNHLHGIISITSDRRGGSRTAPTNGGARGAPGKPLGRLVGAFKTVSTKKINAIRGTPGATVWQRNYYEHTVRSEASLQSIRQYVLNNPNDWESDELYVGGVSRTTH